MKKKKVSERGKTEHLVKNVNMKKWKKSWRNEKKKIKMKKKQVWEYEEVFFLSKEVHIVQNNLERDGANIASWIFDKEKLIL